MQSTSCSHDNACCPHCSTIASGATGARALSAVAGCRRQRRRPPLFALTDCRRLHGLGRRLALLGQGLGGPPFGRALQGRRRAVRVATSAAPQPCRHSSELSKVPDRQGQRAPAWPASCAPSRRQLASRGPCSVPARAQPLCLTPPVITGEKAPPAVHALMLGRRWRRASGIPHVALGGAAYISKSGRTSSPLLLLLLL